MTTVADENDSALLRFTQRAMATVFEIVFPWGTIHADRAAAHAFELIDRLESQFTVFRDTSEVSRLNRIAHQAPVPVERGFFQLLQLCERLSRQTGGAFDITSGPLTKVWGFFARQGHVPSDAELVAAMACVGIETVMLDDVRSTVRFASQGVEINLGSIGKGYALDRVGEMLQTKDRVQSALLHAGTSSILAMGDRTWPAGVKHPHVAQRLGIIRLRNRAMALSGAAYQHFDHNGRKLGHLLDPRTGLPAEGIALAVALAPTAAEADALATAFYVMGVESTQAYCAGHLEVAAVLMADQPDAMPIAFNVTDEWIPAQPDEIYATTVDDE
jgi:FAD:protein FMN transferase